jgi:site-specific DNA-methyltransferase (adenine-specific)
MNKLYYGDNLEVLKSLYEEREPFIDLIYIDPPFNSKRNYNILFEDLIKTRENGEKTTALKEAFSDTWSNVSLSQELEEMKGFDNLKIYNYLEGNRAIFTDSQLSYLTMMAHRLYYMHKLLKETGSLYLHCDPTMSHYLKILLDIIFSEKNFRNEIAWCYRGAGYPKEDFGRRHDIIFRYSKTDNYIFNVDDIREPYAKATIERFKHHIGNIRKGKNFGLQKLNKKGKHPDDWWQIQPVAPSARERLGYPTQKPEALLDRIIKTSSNEGDMVADFFCGCGTSVTVAEKLNRKWLGVDINHLAIGLIEDKRLKSLKAEYEVEGFPKDQAQAEKLAGEKPFKFEEWIVEYVFKGHRIADTRDGGFDGHIAFNDWENKKLCLLEVKGGNCIIKDIRNFDNVIQTQKADMGIFICFKKQVTSGMRKHCDQQGFIEIKSVFKDRIPKIAIITIEEILNRKFPDWLGQFLQNITY